MKHKSITKRGYRIAYTSPHTYTDAFGIKVINPGGWNYYKIDSVLGFSFGPFKSLKEAKDQIEKDYRWFYLGKR